MFRQPAGRRQLENHRPVTREHTPDRSTGSRRRALGAARIPARHRRWVVSVTPSLEGQCRRRRWRAQLLLRRFFPAGPARLEHFRHHGHHTLDSEVALARQPFEPDMDLRPANQEPRHPDAIDVQPVPITCNRRVVAPLRVPQLGTDRAHLAVHRGDLLVLRRTVTKHLLQPLAERYGHALRRIPEPERGAPVERRLAGDLGGDRSVFSWADRTDPASVLWVRSNRHRAT
jgi:hypothetical protein